MSSGYLRTCWFPSGPQTCLVPVLWAYCGRAACDLGGFGLGVCPLSLLLVAWLLVLWVSSGRVACHMVACCQVVCHCPVFEMLLMAVSLRLAAWVAVRLLTVGIGQRTHLINLELSETACLPLPSSPLLHVLRSWRRPNALANRTTLDAKNSMCYHP